MTDRDPLTDADADALLAPLEGTGPHVLAVSGGADSLALMRLVARWNGARAHVVTVDHGFRPGARHEAECVAAWAEACGLDATVLSPPPPEKRDQASARALRYRALLGEAERLNARSIVTAHHLDDQAETVLLRLARGSGLKGLSAMRAETRLGDVALSRPLLGVPGARLKATCRAFGQDWIEDPSNADLRHARVGWRALAEPLAALGLTSGRLAETASRVARAQEAIDHVVALRLRDVASAPGGALTAPIAVLDGPDEFALRTLEALLMIASGAEYGPRLARLEACLDGLRAAAPRRRTLHGCLLERAPCAPGFTIRREAGRRGPPPVPALAPGERAVWDARCILARAEDAPAMAAAAAAAASWALPAHVVVVRDLVFERLEAARRPAGPAERAR